MLKISLLPLIIAALFILATLEGCNSGDSQKDTETESITDGEFNLGETGSTSPEMLKDIFRKRPGESRDLATIKESGVLRAVTQYSSISYFLYRGQTMGFEFELLENLAEYLGLELQVIVAKSAIEMVSLLHQGEADLMAFGLTITNDRKQFVSFTDNLYLSHQVLVQRKPENWRKMKLHEIQQALISDNVELIDKTVSVRANTSYMHRLNNLMEELGDVIYIDTMPNNYKTERLIEMVVDGKIEYTVADYNIASINASYYPELDINVPMSFSQRIGWALSKDTPELLSALNKWLVVIKSKRDFNVIYERYFENKKDFRKRVGDDYYSMESGMVSKYDDLIKKYAAKMDWDWRLVSALVYQESQFNPQAKSWAGAQGLMQLMPATAKELGVTDRTNPEDNIKGGTKYLKEMWENWDDIPDSTQRIKFAMASYNCGYYHVRDAMRLAEADQLEYKYWDDQIEKYILKLSDPEFFNNPVVHYGYVRGMEPFTYVSEIFERYEHYKRFVAK